MPRSQLQRRIARAALTLFRTRGYDAVSVDQIVARAAVSKGAFFNFFPTKADVLLVYLLEIDSQLTRLRGKLDPRKPQASLEKFFARAETILRREGNLIETLAREIWVNPGLFKADRESAARDRYGFAEFFRQAQRKRTIDRSLNPVVAADLMGDLWTGSVLLWLALGRGDRLAATVRPKIRLLFDGFKKRRKR